MSPRLSLVPTLVLGALLGCASGDSRPEAGADGTPGRSAAQVRLEVTRGRSGDVTLSGRAHLFRYRDLDAEAAALIAGADRPDLDELAVGRCRLLLPGELYDDALSRVGTDAQVDLLDAGELTLRAAGQTVRLFPRYVPQAVPFVSGVAYEADLPGAGAPGDTSADVALSAFGGEDVRPFFLPATLPAEPRLVAVGGQSLDSLDGALILDRSAALDIDYTGDRSEPEDVTAVVLSWGDGPTGGALYCRAGDSGRLSVPPGFLSLLPADAHIEVAVERVRRIAFQAGGLDDGVLEVAIRDVAPAHSL